MDLPFRRTYYPLGFPMSLETNSRLIIEATDESWGDYPSIFDAPAPVIRIAVSKEESALVTPSFRSQEHLLAITADAGNFAVCDFRANFGFCWLTANAAADRGYARYYFIEAMVYMLLEARYLTAIHAGCIALNGRGVLLWGRSGAGKSCLSFACARRGWTYVADDGTNLVHNRSDRLVVGLPRQARFRESAAELFPELAGRTALIRPSGSPSIEIRTRELPHIETAFTTCVDHIVFLERQSGVSPRLKPVRKGEALDRLESETALWEDGILREKKANLAVLAGANAWTFRYSDLDSAVEGLTELAARD